MYIHSKINYKLVNINIYKNVYNIIRIYMLLKILGIDPI